MQGRAVRWAAALGVGVLYFLAGKLGLAFALVHANATAVWPPAGIALAAVLLLGRPVWPVIFAGAFLVNISTAGSVLSSLGIAVGNTLEALVGAALVKRFAGGAAAFDRAQDIFKFVVAALLATMVSATLGVTTLALTGHARWADSGAIWLTWWLGDAAGDLIVAPFLLLAVRGKAPGAIGARDRPLEAVLLGGVSVALALGVFRDVITSPAHYPLTFLCLPPLLWSAFRFGARETSALLVLIAAIAVSGTSAGLGAFAVASPNGALLLLQLFLGTLAATSLSIAALIWESRGVERALRERDERLRMSLEAGGLGTWEWTLPTGRIAWSPSLESIHGLPPGTFGGTFDAFEAAVHADDRERLRASIRAALERGEVTMEYRAVRPDGGVRWLEARGVAFYDAAGRPDRLVGVCADVTEDKRADVRVTFLGEIARSITSSLDLDTVLRRVVEGAQALTGSDSSAIMLRDAESGAMVPRHRVGSWWRDWDTLRVTPGRGLGGLAMVTGRPVRTDDYRVDPRVPSEFLALTEDAGTTALMVVPVLVGAEAAGLLYISNRTPRSFTDEDETICVRLAEQAAVAIQNARLFGRQELARAEAEAANRTKDEFLAMLGHELRNPLGAISSAAHVLSRTAAGNSATTRASEIIGRQVQHLARIVDDLLDVSRVVAGKIALRLQSVDLGEIARRVATLYGGPAGTRHVITVHTSPAWVSADATRLEQVLTNLLANAVKYTPAGGEITVTAHRDGDHAVLSVRDTGVGIRPELLPRVFDLFVQADRSLERSAGGLGIGLTLVRQLVQLHGGTVEAESAGPGRGSTFTVRLPILEARPESDAAARPAVAGPAQRVLVVEDNEDAREMLRNLLHLLGHEVHEACDGASGIEEARRLRPDAALIDIGLPGIDGYEVARRIRAEVPRVRLVAVTGYGQPEDRERAFAAGFDVHLVKPVDPEQLQRLLAAPGGGSGSL
jgi:PAS domain S-box-containing protein